MASSSLMTHEPTTRRGRRMLAERSSKLVENVKSAMFIKGPSTSQHVSDVMTEFVRFDFFKEVPFTQFLATLTP